MCVCVCVVSLWDKQMELWEYPLPHLSILWPVRAFPSCGCSSAGVGEAGMAEQQFPGAEQCLLLAPSSLVFSRGDRMFLELMFTQGSLSCPGLCSVLGGGSAELEQSPGAPGAVFSQPLLWLSPCPGLCIIHHFPDLSMLCSFHL